MSRKTNKQPISKAWLIAIVATGWLILVSSLHFWLNYDHSNSRNVYMGYMPVVTNLAAPLLDHATEGSSDTHFHSLKFSSFAEMAEALRHDKIQAAFIIAPLAVVLHQQSKDIKIVYIGNRHESTFVARKDLGVESLKDLSGKTVAVPMRYSGHNLSILQMMEQEGLKGEINIVELNPPDMSAALAAGSLDGYFVGEPFAAQTLKEGSSSLVYRAEEVWDSFICNLVIVKSQLIEDEPETVRRLVSGAVRSGLWAKKHPRQAAAIAAQYWNQPLDLVEYALTVPEGRIVYDQFMPKIDEIQEIADMMVHFKLIDKNDVAGLVDDRFAASVQTGDVEKLEDILSAEDSLSSWTSSREGRTH
ncbi:MAG: ABC transporter substrate-binding protein [Thermodesulfobacteriota bacterium]